MNISTNDIVRRIDAMGMYGRVIGAILSLTGQDNKYLVLFYPINNNAFRAEVSEDQIERVPPPIINPGDYILVGIAGDRDWTLNGSIMKVIRLAVAEGAYVVNVPKFIKQDIEEHDGFKISDDAEVLIYDRDIICKIDIPKGLTNKEII